MLFFPFLSPFGYIDVSYQSDFLFRSRCALFRRPECLRLFSKDSVHPTVSGLNDVSSSFISVSSNQLFMFGKQFASARAKTEPVYPISFVSFFHRMIRSLFLKKSFNSL